MSTKIIRAALEKKLAVMPGNIATAFENVAFAPIAGTPYQRINLLPNTPDNSTQGSGEYIERGLFQIMLCYPLGIGPGAAETQAQLLKAYFNRGLSMTEGAVIVTIVETARVSPSMMEFDRYCIPITVSYQAHITT